MLESDNKEEIKIDKTFLQAVSMIEKLEKVFERNGAFLSGIRKVGGDTEYMDDVRNNLRKAIDSIKDAHYDALNHSDNEEFQLRKPLPKKPPQPVVTETVEVVEIPEPVITVAENQQSYSQLRAEAKEL